MDGTVVAFTFGLALALALLIGLIPILSLRHMNLSQIFREEGRSGTASRGARVMRRALVTAQVAFAFMLLIGAGLLLTSFQRVLAVRPGFEPSHVLTGRVSPPALRYKEDAQLIAFWNQLLDRVRGLPGVQAAGVTTNIPLGGDFSDSVILAEGYAMSPGESLISPYNSSVSPGYFEAMTIPLKRGRLFSASDDERAAKVLIIDERLAARFWKNADPIGRRMWKPESVVNAIRQQVMSLDPELPLFAVKSMQLRVEESLVSRRTPTMLATLFGAVALFLASVGLYGVLAFQVAERRRKIGIRMALGSDGRRIFGLIVSEGLRLVCLGIVVGLAGAFAIRRAMATQLFGVQPMDPVVLALVTFVLGAVALLACAVPARRAARIDPMVALTDQ